MILYKTINTFDKLNLVLDEFIGPIDLLFNLIKERKFNILNLNLFYISNIYVDYVRNNINSMKIDDITKYLSMVTYFFELKSKRIVSQTSDQEKIESEINDDKFIQRILLQKQFKDLVPNLSNRMNNRNKMLTKEEDKIDIKDIFEEELPKSISPTILLKAMQKIFININKNEKDLINIEISEMSIDDITNEIISFLDKFSQEDILLEELLLSLPIKKISKQYLAVIFVSLLVLVRDGNIHLEQDIENNSNTIKIKKIDL